LLDEFVHRLAGLDHEHDAAGLFEEPDHLLDRMGAADVGAFGLFGEELVHPGESAVEGDHAIAVVVHVEDQILAHDGQTNECDIG